MAPRSEKTRYYAASDVKVIVQLIADKFTESTMRPLDVCNQEVDQQLIADMEFFNKYALQLARNFEASYWRTDVTTRRAWARGVVFWSPLAIRELIVNNLAFFRMVSTFGPIVSAWDDHMHIVEKHSIRDDALSEEIDQYVEERSRQWVQLHLPV